MFIGEAFLFVLLVLFCFKLLHTRGENSYINRQSQLERKLLEETERIVRAREQDLGCRVLQIINILLFIY